MTKPDTADAHRSRLGRLTFTPEQEQAVYSRNVSRCQEYIAAGDIYQANLSHRFNVTCAAFSSLEALQTDLSAYDRLRALNPSPFSGLLRFDALRLISSSPERLVRLEGRRVDTRPIAGTRPRGNNLADDQRQIQELRTNEKERAEHVMLVDLERNDLGRVCRFGSVQVDELMTLEQYSHVNHLVSHVAGVLQDHATGFDLLEAMFPGGTITGRSQDPLHGDHRGVGTRTPRSVHRLDGLSQLERGPRFQYPDTHPGDEECTWAIFRSEQELWPTQTRRANMRRRSIRPRRSSAPFHNPCGST